MRYSQNCRSRLSSMSFITPYDKAGGKCFAEAKKRFASMYNADASIEVPAGDAKVWRYSDIAKFIRVLQTRALFFSMAERFTDRFEGALTRPSLAQCVKIFMGASGLSEEQ